MITIHRKRKVVRELNNIQKDKNIPTIVNPYYLDYIEFGKFELRSYVLNGWAKEVNKTPMGKELTELTDV